MKKIIFAVTFIIIVLVAVKIFFLSANNQFKSPVSNSSGQTTSITPTSTSTKEGVKEYLDPAGFKFSYPNTLTVNPQEINDDKTYSDLQITSASVNGKITINIKDSQLTKIDEYFKNKKISGVTKIKIADLDGRQYIDNNQMKTVAHDQGALITIITDFQKDKEFWSNSTAKIIATFTFVPPENTSSGSTSTGGEGDVVLEDEEVIE